MGRTVKIAGVAALAGIMVTVGIASVSRPELDAPVARGTKRSMTAAVPVDMSRCRTITMPESGCEAAWEAKRRRFFGRDDKQ